jgi:uncharacterized protein YyaL (SSP411 family)
MPTTITGLARKIAAVWAMRRLDAAARREQKNRTDSLHGTLEWLARAQDATADDGVSYGYGLADGWTISYPETTGYILQTFVWYHEIFGSDAVWERARRMARWEVDIQMPSGATPGRFGTARPVPVAFNTGQVLLGWAQYLRRENDTRVRDAAARAGRWLVACMKDQPYFADGVSAEAEHGDLSYNSMVSWGLAELGDALGDASFVKAAQKSARHYAELVYQQGWPYRAGFSNEDSQYPLTHNLGYTIQGLLETGRVVEDPTLGEVARTMLDAARPMIDPRSGFLPGRIRPGWRGGSSWACLTGSAQFACSYLRLVMMGHDKSGYAELASQLVDYVVGTQVGRQAAPEIAYGVRGSYPFRFGAYQPATLLNWAAKFFVDALLMHQRLGRL